jgi:hypothetical protein
MSEATTEKEALMVGPARERSPPINSDADDEIRAIVGSHPGLSSVPTPQLTPTPEPGRYRRADYETLEDLKDPLCGTTRGDLGALCFVAMITSSLALFILLISYPSFCGMSMAPLNSFWNVYTDDYALPYQNNTYWCQNSDLNEFYRASTLFRRSVGEWAVS